jgi:hypothetical protein
MKCALDCMLKMLAGQFSNYLIERGLVLKRGTYIDEQYCSSIFVERSIILQLTAKISHKSSVESKITPALQLSAYLWSPFFATTKGSAEIQELFFFCGIKKIKIAEATLIRSNSSCPLN